MQLFNDKRIALIGKTINGIFNVTGGKKVKLADAYVTFNKNTYPLDTGKPAYRRKSKFYYLIDVDNGQQTMGATELSISPELYDLEFHNHILIDLLRAMKKNKLSTEAALLVLMAIGMGIPVGYIFGLAFPIGG